MATIKSDPYKYKTPLEKAVGFKAAEEAYGYLLWREQIILDLMIVGWTQAQIASVFEVTQPSITSAVRRIRFKLANTQLYQLLEVRQEIRENLRSGEI